MYRQVLGWGWGLRKFHELFIAKEKKELEGRECAENEKVDLEDKGTYLPSLPLAARAVRGEMSPLRSQMSRSLEHGGDTPRSRLGPRTCPVSTLSQGRFREDYYFYIGLP